MNDSEEVWRWVHIIYVMSWIIKKLNSLKKLVFPWCFQEWLIESTKWLLIGMNYECECIKKCNKLNHTKIAFYWGETALTLLLPRMFYLIDKLMNESDSVWIWSYQKYVMSWIIQKYHSVGKTTALTLLLPTILDWVEFFDWIDKTMNDSD